MLRVQSDKAEWEREGKRKKGKKKNKINLHANVKAKANCKRSRALPRVRSRRLQWVAERRETKREREGDRETHSPTVSIKRMKN